MSELSAISHALVSIVIVTWNSAKHLQPCLDSVLAQTYPNIELLVIDNASDDGSPELLKSKYPQVRLVKNQHNVGFGAAHNQGLHLARGEYYLPLNPDVTMTPIFVEELVQAIRRTDSQPSAISHKRRPEPVEGPSAIGAVSGKLLRPAPNPGGGQGEAIVDSTGLFLDRLRRTYDRGQGEVDQGQYDHSQYVFTACGAAPLYRRAMLEDVAVDGEIFDEDFFAYYDDADLGWRAQLGGWKCIYTPHAVAYHARGRDAILRKEVAPPLRFVQVHGVKNRYLMMVKNDALGYLALDMPFLLAYETARALYLMASAPRAALLLFRGLLAFLKLLPQALTKRRIIQERKAVPDAYIRRWFHAMPSDHRPSTTVFDVQAAQGSGRWTVGCKSPIIQWDDALTPYANLAELRYRDAIQLSLDRYDSAEKWQRIIEDGRLTLIPFLRQRGIHFQGSILELGAGMCWLSSEFSKIPAVRELYALDFSPVLLERIAPGIMQHLGAEEAKITRVVGDFNHLRFPDSTFDFVVADAALHHAVDLPRVLQEAARVLKDDGQLIAIAEPVLPRWRPSKRETYSWEERRYGLTENIYTLDEWREAFELCGLKVEFIPHIHYTSLIGRLVKYSPLPWLNGYLYAKFVFVARKTRR